MTQIISYANRNFALQVGDRLVSERRPRQPISPRDPLFNKHVLFLAKDAIVSIGFAGLAYVTGVPTDQWIASVLYGKPLPGPQGSPGRGTRISTDASGRIFEAQWPDIGRATERLQAACNNLYLTLPRRQQEEGLYISIVGWQWKWRWRHGAGAGHHIRPIVLRIFFNGRTPATSPKQRVERYWGWEKGRGHLEAVPRMPPGMLSRLLADLGSRQVLTEDIVERMLVEAIQEIAEDASQGVGRHCLSVSISPRRDPLVQVRYRPWEIGTTGQPAAVGASYSGWIVTPNVTQAPQQISMSPSFDVRLEVGWFTIGFEGPRRPEDGRGYMGTHPRRPPP